MGRNRLRWLAAAITTTALAMTGAGVAYAAPTPSPTPPVSASQQSAGPQASGTTTPSGSPARSTATATGSQSTPSTTPQATGTATRSATSTPASTAVSTAASPKPSPSTTPSKAVRATRQVSPASGTPVFVKSLVYATTTVTVRAGATTSSKALGTLQRGNHVGTRNAGNGTATANGWTAVVYQGRNAWIKSDYLSATKPPFQKYIVYATATVPVRVSPSLAARAIASMKRGDHVAAIGIAQKGFTPVSYKGTKAWVQTSYLSRSKPVPNPERLDNRCLSGLVVCISKNDRKLRLVQNGKILITLDARFGGEAGPTREGTFSIYRKDKDWVSTLYGSAMPYSMFFSGGEAIHYSSDFAARGYNGNSHGCVNIRSWSGIQYVWNHAPLGTKVVVYK